MAQQPPLDRPARRSEAGKVRVWKDGYAKVNCENIRGVSPGRGSVSDQRVKPFGTRTLGKGRRPG
jgi:hypothetical protein